MMENMFVILSQVEKQDRERRFRQSLKIHRSRFINGKREIGAGAAAIRLFTRNLHIY